MINGRRTGSNIVSVKATIPGGHTRIIQVNRNTERASWNMWKNGKIVRVTGYYYSAISLFEPDDEKMYQYIRDNYKPQRGSFKDGFYRTGKKAA